MKDTNTALIALVGVVAAGMGSGGAQEAYPPYSPTPNELRAQSLAPSPDRVGKLEQRVTNIELILGDRFNQNGTAVPPQPKTDPSKGAQPAPDPREVHGPRGPGQYHTIQDGETLHGIARNYGVALEQLVSSNNLDAYGPIYVGDRLWIPGANPQPQPPAPTPPPATPGTLAVSGGPGWTSSYQVRPGDTLHSIARKAGVTPLEIANHNRLINANQIFVGQLLVLPEGQPPADISRRHGDTVSQAEETFHYYDVRVGDTLSSIARIFYTTDEELRRINSLNGNQLQVGQQLIVPTRIYFEEMRRQQQQQSPLS